MRGCYLSVSKLLIWEFQQYRENFWVKSFFFDFGLSTCIVSKLREWVWNLYAIAYYTFFGKISQLCYNKPINERKFFIQSISALKINFTFEETRRKRSTNDNCSMAMTSYNNYIVVYITNVLIFCKILFYNLIFFVSIAVWLISV